MNIPPHSEHYLVFFTFLGGNAISRTGTNVTAVINKIKAKHPSAKYAGHRKYSSCRLAKQAAIKHKESTQ